MSQDYEKKELETAENTPSEETEAAASVNEAEPAAEVSNEQAEVKSEAQVEAKNEPAAEEKAETQEAPAAEAAAPATDEDAEKEAKRKAAAEARAARAAERAKKAEAEAEAGSEAPATDEDAEKEAKRKAAAEARAARAAERAKKAEAESEAEQAPKEPSPNQPRLDRLVQIIAETVGPDAVEGSFINEHDRDLPVVAVKPADWLACAQQLKDHPELELTFLRNVSGVDYETHLEVVYHLINFDSKHDYCVKVKTDREQPSIPSVTSVWSTADWNEREIYDLLGIDFPGHPDLRRIMMPDDWDGHPLRKDYVPTDPEV